MSFTDDVVRKEKYQQGLNGKEKEKFQKQKIHDVLDPEFWNQKDFFRQVDEIIKSGREDKLFLNSLNKLYKDPNKVEIINSNPYCFENISNPEGKYELTNDEVQILQEINDHNSKLLQGIKIGELYNTTKIVLCDAPKDSDLLGSYYLEEIAHYNGSLCPVIEIYMDKVEAVAKELGCDRAYVTACVYIHEMMHRYYDIRPDLGWKKSVKEIEEPMAVFGAMKFCEEFDKELLKMSRRLTEDLQKSERYDLFQYYVYILGLEMLDNGVDAGLINTYRHVSLMMHKSRSEVDGFVNPIDSYVDLCKQNRNNLENLVGPIQTIIGRYFSLFLNK
jgi:hypothetical protein